LRNAPTRVETTLTQPRHSPVADALHLDRQLSCRALKNMALVPRVPADLLIRAHGTIGSTALRPDTLDAATAALAHRGGPDQAQAVVLRLIAFRKLAAARAADGWSLAIDGKSYPLTERALFAAVAQAPLRLPRSLLMKDLAFRSYELLAIALASVPPLKAHK
jgi:hypothetical protein